MYFCCEKDLHTVLLRKKFTHFVQKVFCALKLPFQKFRLFGPLARIWKGGGSDDRLKVEIHVRSSTDPIHQPHCGQLFNKSSSCHHSLHRSGSFAYSQTLFFSSVRSSYSLPDLLVIHHHTMGENHSFWLLKRFLIFQGISGDLDANLLKHISLKIQ